VVARLDVSSKWGGYLGVGVFKSCWGLRWMATDLGKLLGSMFEPCSSIYPWLPVFFTMARGVNHWLCNCRNLSSLRSELGVFFGNWCNS